MFRHTLTIPTHLSPEEAAKRLAAAVTGSWLNYYDVKTVRFSGKVSSSGFQIRPILRITGAFLPLFEGRFAPDDGGSVLVAESHFTRVHEVFLLVWSFGLFLIFVASVASAIRGNAPFWAPLAPLGILGAGIALAYCVYTVSNKKAEALLRELLEAASPEHHISEKTEK